jgi:hypothetical protein
VATTPAASLSTLHLESLAMSQLEAPAMPEPSSKYITLAMNNPPALAAVVPSCLASYVLAAHIDPQLFQAIASALGPAIAAAVVAVYRETRKVKKEVNLKVDVLATDAEEARQMATRAAGQVRSLEDRVSSVPDSESQQESYLHLSREVGRLEKLLLAALMDRDDSQGREARYAGLIERQQREIMELRTKLEARGQTLPPPQKAP